MRVKYHARPRRFSNQINKGTLATRNRNAKQFRLGNNGTYGLTIAPREGEAMDAREHKPGERGLGLRHRTKASAGKSLALKHHNEISQRSQIRQHQPTYKLEVKFISQPRARFEQQAFKNRWQEVIAVRMLLLASGRDQHEWLTTRLCGVEPIHSPIISSCMDDTRKITHFRGSKTALLAFTGD
jgi:hypothetical protein